MREILMKIVVVLSLFAFSARASFSQCDSVNVDYAKELLGNVIYDNFRSTEIMFSDHPYDIEFQVDLLKSFVYKLVFDMSAKSEGVVIKLYDLGKKKQKEEPKLLYTSSEELMDDNAIFDVTFIAPKTRMLIKYEVKDATYKGCVTFALGVFQKEKIPESTTLDFRD